MSFEHTHHPHVFPSTSSIVVYFLICTTVFTPPFFILNSLLHTALHLSLCVILSLPLLLRNSFQASVNVNNEDQSSAIGDAKQLAAQLYIEVSNVVLLLMLLLLLLMLLLAVTVWALVEFQFCFLFCFGLINIISFTVCEKPDNDWQSIFSKFVFRKCIQHLSSGAQSSV